LRAGIRGDPAWIDTAVPPDADVAAIWSGAHSRGWKGPYTIWMNEFFNRSVGTVYDLRKPLTYRLPSHRVTVGVGGVLESGGRPVRAAYVLTDTTAPVVGRRVGADPQARMLLFRVGGVVRLLEPLRKGAT
jgi:hypothetical protein